MRRHTRRGFAAGRRPIHWARGWGRGWGYGWGEGTRRQRTPADVAGVGLRAGWRWLAARPERRVGALLVVAALAIALTLGVGVFGGAASRGGARAQVAGALHAQAPLGARKPGAPSVRMATPPTTPRWVDPAHKTALSLQTTQLSAKDLQTLFPTGEPAGVTFYIVRFTLPDTTQVIGAAVGDANLQGSQQTIQLVTSSLLAYDSATGAIVVTGTAGANIQATRAIPCGVGVVVGANVTSVALYSVVGFVAADMLSAYADVSYAPFAVGQANSATTCATIYPPATAKLHAEMDTGCYGPNDPTPCRDPQTMAGPTTGAYDQAIIAEDWATAYALCAPDISGQYDEGAFANAMQRQAQQHGRITAISSPTAIQIAFTYGGQAYYTTTQQVTYTLNGSTTTRTLTSYFLLDGGQWRFWFSEPGR